MKNALPVLTVDPLTGLGTQGSKATVDDRITVTGSFSDVGTLDGHTVIIDWGEIDDGAPNADDDRTFITFAADDPKGFSETHQYATGGIFTITVTVIDDDTGQAANSSTEVWVSGVRLDPNTGELQIVGTSGKDIVNVKLVGGGSDNVGDGGPGDAVIKVTANLDVQGSDSGSDRGADNFFFHLDDVGSIRIVLCEGDDHAIVGAGGSDGGSGGGRKNGLKNVPTLIEGNAGDDHLTGGVGPDTILGGPGRDKLNGRGGLDILIGGLGGDDIKGGKQDDILIGGIVTLDNGTLEDVRDIWTGVSSYLSRVATLTAVGGLLEANVKLLDDGAKDTLRGQIGRDLFFAKIGGSNKDDVRDKRANEGVFELF